jgi:hypothetical protein
MKKRILISTILASLLLSTSALYAGMTNSVSSKEIRAINNPSSVKGHALAEAEVKKTNSHDATQAKFDTKNFKIEAEQDDAKILKKVSRQEALEHRQDLKKAPKEVIEALQQSVIGLRALQQNKTAPAKIALQKATELFDTALMHNPKLDVIPIADNVQVKSFTANAKTTKHIIDSAQKLLADHDTQAARTILLPLQDEIDMTTELLPMAIYTHATKQALQELNKGNTQLSFSLLATALHSTIIETTVVPLPLLMSQDLTLSASKLDKSKKKTAQKLLTKAQDELQKAVYLGYTKKI